MAVTNWTAACTKPDEPLEFARESDDTIAVSMLMSFFQGPRVGYAVPMPYIWMRSIVWTGPATRQAARIAFPEAATQRG